jgi:hypothetical protein
MLERRWRLDLAACGLLVTGLLLAVSVFSYDPADPPGARVYPAHSAETNLLGPAGAWLAQLLHETLGLAVYLLLASWFVLVVLLFLRRGVLTWSLRLAGWLLLVPCAAMLGDFFGSTLAGGPLAGGGGTLGAWLNGWLAAEFQPFGRTALLAGSLLLGLVLVAGAVLDRVLRGMGRSARWVLRVSMPVAASLASAVSACGARLLSWRTGLEAMEPALAFTAQAENVTASATKKTEPDSTDIPIRHHDEGAAALAATLESVPVEPLSEAQPRAPVPIQRPAAESDMEHFADF